MQGVSLFCYTVHNLVQKCDHNYVIGFDRLGLLFYDTSHLQWGSDHRGLISLTKYYQCNGVRSMGADQSISTSFVWLGRFLGATP
jgi:hypothetical protein